MIHFKEIPLDLNRLCEIDVETECKKKQEQPEVHFFCRMRRERNGKSRWNLRITVTVVWWWITERGEIVMYVSLKSITTNTYTLPTSETLPTYHTLYNTLSTTSETASSPPDPLPSSPPPSSLLVPSSSSSPSSSPPPSSPPPTLTFTPHSHLIPVSQLVVQMEHGAITP